MIDTLGLRVTVRELRRVHDLGSDLTPPGSFLPLGPAADPGVLAEYGGSAGARLRDAGRGDGHGPVRRADAGTDLRRPGSALHHFRPCQARRPLVPRPPASYGQHDRLHV